MAELRDPNMSIVLLGRMNPLIFSPEWLSKNNVIGAQEAAVARESGIEVMAPNIVSINFGSMKLVVEEQRFMIFVTDEPLVRARDFTVASFMLLRHTPIAAVGINYAETLFETDSKKWNRFGDTLAPKAPWGAFLTDKAGGRLGGLRTIVMDRQNELPPGCAYMRLTVDVAEGANRQAMLNVNNHFNLGTPEQQESGTEAFKLIENVWDEMLDMSKDAVERVRGIADAA